MPARDRSREFLELRIGSYRRNGAPDQVGQCYNGIRERCQDFVGAPHQDNGFDKRTEESWQWILDGRLDISSSEYREFLHAPCTGGYILPPSYNDVVNQPTLTNSQLNQYALKTYAQTNPNVPHVDVPTFVAELKDFKDIVSLKTLKDLPALVRDSGRDFLRKIASANLSWRWAIRPLISDVRKLLKYHELVNNKVKELQRLKTGQWQRRRIQLDSKAHDSNWVLETVHSASGYLVRAWTRVESRSKTWATTRWRVKSTAVIPSVDDELRSLAIKLTYGLTSAQALNVAWELLPWSWLVDWFAHIDDVIDYTNNTVPMETAGVCVMRHFTARKVYRLHQKPDWVSISGPMYQQLTQKVRRVVPTVLPFAPSIPIIDWGRGSILGSLAVLKGYNLKGRL